MKKGKEKVKLHTWKNVPMVVSGSDSAVTGDGYNGRERGTAGPTGN